MLRRAAVRCARPMPLSSVKASMAKRTSSPFHAIDEDMVDTYEKMQVGIEAQRIWTDKRKSEEESKLPLEERIRRAMVRNGSFSVDLVTAAGMDPEVEYVRYNKAMRSKARKGSTVLLTWAMWIIGAMSFVYYFFAIFFTH
jgi:hypothetical protein